MASLVLFGSDVAATTPSTACQMSNTTGGTETSKTTTLTGASTWGEITSQGGTVTLVASLPTPTGKGWVYPTGAGTFATGNWSASIGYAESSAESGFSLAVRFYRLSSGVYTSIGLIDIDTQSATTSRVVKTFPATSLSTITFGASDLLYVDFWGTNSNNPVIFESTSASAGVTSDMQITTSSFTASGVTHRIICDGYGGMFI